jgi:hypothetical protein
MQRNELEHGEMSRPYMERSFVIFCVRIYHGTLFQDKLSHSTAMIRKDYSFRLEPILMWGIQQNIT